MSSAQQHDKQTQTGSPWLHYKHGSKTPLQAQAVPSTREHKQKSLFSGTLQNTRRFALFTPPPIGLHVSSLPPSFCTMVQWRLLVATAVAVFSRADAGGQASVQAGGGSGQVVKPDNSKGGIDVDVTVDYDANATTTATSPDIRLSADFLESPAPCPAPSPSALYGSMPPLPAPALSPEPGPESNWQYDICTAQHGCNGQSCDLCVAWCWPGDALTACCARVAGNAYSLSSI